MYAFKWFLNGFDLISFSSKLIFVSMVSTNDSSSLQFTSSSFPFSIIEALILRIIFVTFLILFFTINPLSVGSINSLVAIAIINPIIIDINLCKILTSFPTPT